MSEQERFEKWLQQAGNTVEKSPLSTAEAVLYRYASVQFAWEAWQKLGEEMAAEVQRLQAELERVRTELQCADGEPAWSKARELRQHLQNANRKNEQQLCNCRNDRTAREAAEERINQLEDRIRDLRAALLVSYERRVTGPTDVV